MDDTMRQVVQGAAAHMHDVLGPAVQSMRAGNTPTDEEQLDEYAKVRGDPYATANLVVSKMRAYEALTGRKMGIDPLTAARQYEQAMERLRLARS